MTLLAGLASFFLPRTCAVCGSRLMPSEEGVLCAACLLSFPFIRPPYVPGGKLERSFWGRLPVVRTAALFHYQAGAATTRVILRIKYGHRPGLGRHFGLILGRQLAATDFFDGVDAIVPVPLSRARRRQRGYNQSTYIARGLSQASGLPVEENVVRRVVDNQSQTQVGAHRRADNVEGIFRVDHPERIAGRHLLLVDDVLTTGSTLVSCGRELARAPGLRLSIAVLGSTADFPDLLLDP